MNVEFNLNQKITIIQANLDDPFQSIIEQYIQKAPIEPNSVYLIANSKPIELKQTLENHMNDIDKQNNKLTVFVNVLNKEGHKNEKNVLIHSNDIICPECKEPCRFTLDNYKIKLFDCVHNHVKSDIKLSDFYQTQKNEKPDIICASCKNTNKGCINNSEFFQCLTCKETLCLPCKEKHDSNHSIIKYYQKNYICSKHNNFFDKYCNVCHSNICSLCGTEHLQHKTTVYSDLKTDIEGSKKQLTEFRAVLDTMTEQIHDIIEKLKKFLEDMNIYYEINNNILKNYEENNINYQILKNINEINNNKIFERIKNINSYTNIKDKIQDILDLYININEKKENEITPKNIEEKSNKISLIYKVERDEEYIKLFGTKFVENNKNNFYMIINGEQIELSEYVQLNKNEYKILEVDLIEIEPITNMSYMFSECKSLKSLSDIPNMYRGNVTDMSFMFNGCNILKSLPDISKWDIKNVNNMSCLFKDSRYLRSLPDISKWDTKNVTDMNSMFYACGSLESLPDISKWDTRNVTNMESMFSAFRLISLPDISKWNTKNVTNMSCLFKYSSYLTSLPDISKWDTKSVTDMNSMFYSCGSLDSLPDISKWDTRNVTRIDNMFYFCMELQYLPDISKWDTRNIINMENIFSETKLDYLPDISKWNTRNVTNMNGLFNKCQSLESLPDISKWDTKNVTIMNSMFNECKSLKSLPDISKWDTKNVTDMCSMFNGCESLISLPDISKWDTRNVTTMNYMFNHCSSLISFPNISKWILKKSINTGIMTYGVNPKIVPRKFRGCLIY